MTELLELVSAANIADFAADDLCPFCHKKPPGHNSDDPKDVDDQVTSKPSGLGCNIVRRKTGDLPHTTAAHHLISAIQCYSRIRRLVRMGNMVGYDINCPNNGIGLPTTHYTLKYPEGGERKKYGDLSDPDGKQKVAFALMEELGAQWHVGHHAFEVDLGLLNKDFWDSGGSEEQDGSDNGHHVSYDTTIIGMLMDLLASLVPGGLCEEDKPEDKFKQDMDEISKEIKDKLEKFKAGNPSSSAPLFVSRKAFDYARNKEPIVVDDDNPIDA